MTTLADVISVSGRFARSANLERRRESVQPLDGYIVTAGSWMWSSASRLLQPRVVLAVPGR